MRAYTLPGPVADASNRKATRPRDVEGGHTAAPEETGAEAPQCAPSLPGDSRWPPCQCGNKERCPELRDTPARPLSLYGTSEAT